MQLFRMVEAQHTKSRFDLFDLSNLPAGVEKFEVQGKCECVDS